MPTKLEQLEELAHQNKIHIHDYHFSETKKAACMRHEDYKAIALDRSAIESAAEESVLLAEEVGHYETGSLYLIESTYNSPIARSNRNKFEAHARRWAFEKLLSPEEIEKGMRVNCGDVWLAAEYCQVTVDFLIQTIEHYRSYGTVFSFDKRCDDGEYEVSTIQLEIHDDIVEHSEEKTVEISYNKEVTPHTGVKNEDVIATEQANRPIELDKNMSIREAVREGFRPKRRWLTDDEFIYLINGISDSSFSRRASIIQSRIDVECLYI
ncbi:MAG: hypothetical protein FWC73_11280 [Defluviitaleaceae bacterium]|nr:hypothetical protein [Defluviitaleaceae bacterium]